MEDVARNKTAISNVRVFDGSGITEPRTVIIHGHVIGDGPDGDERLVDGQGGVLIPGLIDAHVHLQHLGHLQELVRYGITTALDMACWPADKIDRLRAKSGLPDIRSAGLPVTATGSLHSHILPLPEEAMLAGPEKAHEFVEKRVAEGSDYIKIICDIPGPTQETLDEVVRKAHGRNKKVVAHASAYGPFCMALEAGADIITHAPRDKPVDNSIVTRMASGSVVSVPTLIMMKEVSKRPPLGTILKTLLKPSMLATIAKTKRASQGTPSYENAKASVAVMHGSGVPILAGTDCHEEEASFADVKHGVSMHQELELLVEAGLSPVEALRAATILPAQFFDLHDRGSITPGKRADMVLLREDPVNDIRATRSIARVWCNGLELSF